MNYVTEEFLINFDEFSHTLFAKQGMEVIFSFGTKLMTQSDSGSRVGQRWRDGTQKKQDWELKVR